MSPPLWRPARSRRRSPASNASRRCGACCPATPLQRGCSTRYLMLSAARGETLPSRIVGRQFACPARAVGLAAEVVLAMRYSCPLFLRHRATADPRGRFGKNITWQEYKRLSRIEQMLVNGPPRQFCMTEQDLPQPDEGPHDLDVNGHHPITAEDAGQQGHALFLIHCMCGNRLSISSNGIGCVVPTSRSRIRPVDSRSGGAGGCIVRTTFSSYSSICSKARTSNGERPALGNRSNSSSRLLCTIHKSRKSLMWAASSIKRRARERPGR